MENTANFSDSLKTKNVKSRPGYLATIKPMQQTLHQVIKMGFFNL